MPEINNPVQALGIIQRGRKDSLRDWWKTNYALCKTFGWDYETLMRQPIRFNLLMIEMMNWEAKETEKAHKKSMNKSKRRR